MSKHTEGLAEVKNNFNLFIGRECIANCGGRSSNAPGNTIYEENIANAERLAECWNLFHGIPAPTAALERLLTAAETAETYFRGSILNTQEAGIAKLLREALSEFPQKGE